MADKQTIYYDKRAVEMLKESFKLSPSTLHKIMHPYCAECLAEQRLSKGKFLGGRN